MTLASTIANTLSGKHGSDSSKTVQVKKSVPSTTATNTPENESDQSPSEEDDQSQPERDNEDDGNASNSEEDNRMEIDASSHTVKKHVNGQPTQPNQFSKKNIDSIGDKSLDASKSKSKTDSIAVGQSQIAKSSDKPRNPMGGAKRHRMKHLDYTYKTGTFEQQMQTNYKSSGLRYMGDWSQIRQTSKCCLLPFYATNQALVDRVVRMAAFICDGADRKNIREKDVQEAWRIIGQQNQDVLDGGKEPSRPKTKKIKTTDTIVFA